MVKQYLFFLLIPNLLVAEIYLCDGEWTNRNCDGDVAVSFEEAPYTPPSEERQLANDKELLVHDLNMKRVDANREYDLSLDISSERELCVQPETSVSACRKAILQKEIQIDERIIAQLKVQREKQEKRKARESEQPFNVAVVKNYVLYGYTCRDKCPDNDPKCRQRRRNGRCTFTTGSRTPRNFVNVRNTNTQSPFRSRFVSRRPVG